MFGVRVKELRLKHELSLRDFCRQTGEDPSNWSKIERGLSNPPQERDRLEKVAKVVGIRIKSDEFQELSDMAKVEAGRLPEDVAHDKEMLAYLPAFLRTIRNEKPTEEDVMKIIKFVKEGL